MISGIITTYNEEDNIEGALSSIEWLDELIVVDSFSSDRTVEIAKSKGAKILQREYDNPSSQKNWAIPQARYEWILLLDADERCTDELKTEVLATVKNPNCDAYWIPRKNYFMGKHVKYSGWQGDKVIRLFRRDTCKYNDNWVHEEIITDKKVGFLSSKLIHNTYKNIPHYKAKMERYAEYAVQDLLKKKKSVGFFHLHIKPIARFLKHYIFQLGVLDGKVGLTISKISAHYVKLKYQKLKKHLDSI